MSGDNGNTGNFSAGPPCALFAHTGFVVTTTRYNCVYITMRITSWLLLLCLVHGEQISKRSSSALLRQRRRILDMDILMAISNKKDTQQRSLKKSQEDDCNTGDYLMDLFHCGGDKEMSMSMAVPSASPPTIPLPPVAPVPTISITFEPTTAPFALCRSQDRSQAIVAAIRKEFPDPNGEAIDWLIFQDPAQLDPCTDDLLQRYALVSFYFQTNGASWTDNAQWLSAASECSWTGISCTANDSVQILSLRKYGSSYHPLLLAHHNFISWQQSRGTIPWRVATAHRSRSIECLSERTFGNHPRSDGIDVTRQFRRGRKRFDR